MTTSLSREIKFVTLCQTFEKVIKSRSNDEKINILQIFINHCRNIGKSIEKRASDADLSLYPLMRLILPSFERERSSLKLKEKSLANIYIRVFYLDKKKKDAQQLLKYKVSNSEDMAATDFAGRVYHISRNRLLNDESSFTIERINKFLDDVSQGNMKDRRKDELFKELVEELSALELKWLTRIILKDLKLGIKKKKILEVYHPDAAAYYNGMSDLYQICERLKNPRIKMQSQIQIFYHFKPMLLEMCSIENIAKLFLQNEQYFVQTKFDGERSQIHMKDGVFKYFTRQGFDITNNSSYGERNSSGGFLTIEISRLLHPDCKSLIMDGELMGWHKEKRKFGSKGQNFDVKKLSSNSRHQPCFVAYDLILYNDEVLINDPYEHRLNLLQTIFSEKEGVLVNCKSIKIDKCDELLTNFQKSIDDNEEGIVVKKVNFNYKPNVRDGGGCYKIKAEYSGDLVNDLDLIVLGGYYGEGRHTGLINSFLMGIVNNVGTAQQPSKFKAVVSVSTGLSNEDIKQLQSMFVQHGSNACPRMVQGPKFEPPDLWIPPEKSIILTLRASEMLRSAMYPTGYSLRFPRVLKIRRDKPWYGACSETEFFSLIKDKGPIQKLTKKRTARTEIKVEDAQVLKFPRLRGSTILRTAGKYIDAKLQQNEVKPISRLLEGKEICVIIGNNEYPKEKIEEVLLQHRAKVVQNPGKSTFCVIVANPRVISAKNLIKSGNYNVVNFDWFKRVTNKKNWGKLEPFYPWDFLSVRNDTKSDLDNIFDKFHDNYTVNADEESLKRSMKRAHEMTSHMKIKQKAIKEVDQMVFRGLPSFSLFRDIVGYFRDPHDISKLEFQFLAGRISEELDGSVTYIFVNTDVSNTEIDESTDVENQQLMLIPIVDNKWISKCFQRKEFLATKDYFLN
ncbi:DNA ligase 4-like isoform X2 [Prorops nasuta]